MHNKSKDSPSKRSKVSQSQKSRFTQSFRTKTQKAIQMINKHEQYKYDFLKTLSNSNKFMMYTSSLKRDEQYYNIIQIPQLQIEQSIKIQLVPYTDKLYKIINPFYININNTKQHERNKSLYIQQQEDDQLSSQGTVPIQNSQFNNNNKKKYQNKQHNINKSFLQHQNNHQLFQTNYKLKIYIKNYKGAPTQLFIYFQHNSTIKDFNLHFHKFIINTQKIINIPINDFIDKKYIYLRLKSKSQLSMFTMRVDQQSIVKKRIITEITQTNQSWDKHQINKKLPQLKGTRSLKSFKNLEKDKNKSNSLKKSGSLILGGSMNKISSNNQMSPSSKKKNKQILQQLKKQQLFKKKEQQQKKHQQILQKKFDIQLAKQKQLKLKSKALQMKKLVSQYKIIYQDQKQYIKYLQPKIAALFIIPRFHKVCHQMITQRQKGMKMAWKTRMLTKKFMNVIKNKYKDSIQHIKSRKPRQLVGILNFTTLFAKILNKNAIQKSHIVIMSTIKHCNPGLIVNHSFDLATIYRRSIRTIQRTWLMQYKARMEMFQIYVKNQAQSLITKYPYFKYIQAKFHTDNVPKTLAYKYLADESSKLKYLFQDYQQKMKQIDDFKEMNKKIAQFNKTALKKRQKPYLDVPKDPCFPSLRYFRNISFLKSMIRGWFELEYRKWSKANISYLSSVQADKKKPVSPQKSIIIKPSINSVELSSPRKDNN